MDTNDKEISVSQANENESADTKDRKINNFTYLLPLKIMLFLAALAAVTGLIGLVGRIVIDDGISGGSNYKSITKNDKSASKYEDSTFFLNDINNLSRYIISNYRAEANSKLDFDENSSIFKEAEYKECNVESADASSDVVKIDAKNVYNLKSVYDFNPYFKDNVENGNIEPKSNYELFYNDLSEYYKRRLGDKYFDNAEYLHLTSEEYTKLLETYLSSNYYDFKVSDEFENLDEYGDGEAYYNEELNRGIFVIPNESIDIIDFNSGKNNTFPIDEVYLSEDNYLEFSYSFEDIYIKTSDIYIPLDLLDLSSYDNFAKSVITTPFARNIETLASLYVTNSEEYKEHNLHIDDDSSSLIYTVSYSVDGKNKAKLSAGTFGKDDMIIYNPSNNTFDNDTKKRFSTERLNEIKAAFYEIGDEYEQSEINETYMNVDKITFAPSFENRLKFAFYKYNMIFNVLFGAGVLMFVLLLVLITVFEKRAVLRCDRWFFEIKTVLIISLLVGCVLPGELNASELLSYGSLGIYIFLPLFIVLGIISYNACLLYYLGSVRLIKNREFIRYILTVRVLRFLIIKLKKGLAVLGDLFGNLNLGIKTLGITVAYGFVNFVVMFIASLIAADYSAMEPIAFAIILLFIFNVCFVIYKWKEKRSYDKIGEGIDRILDGELDYQIDTGDMTGVVKDLTLKVNRIGEGLDKAVAASLKDERMKAELITNVSHDIKTPLTSIINYVDLIKREGIKDEPLKGYIDVLDMKSMRLKSLIEDLLEASKASTGNLEIEPATLNLHELISQVSAEYEDKFDEKSLTLIANEQEGLKIYADGRRIYRVIDNIFQNAYKYSMPNTRVYLDTGLIGDKVSICLKNVSEQQLNIEVDELLERFTRGDESRNTEGNGLGLSIASNLTKLQNGEFSIELDGDLFKVTILMPKGE